MKAFTTMSFFLPQISSERPDHYQQGVLLISTDSFGPNSAIVAAA
jgi:hypothetical protein